MVATGGMSHHHPNVRVVRPRPLAADDRIPVYWAGREAPPQIKAIDGGTLFDYLASCDSQSASKKKQRQKAGRYRAPKEGIPSTPGDRAAAHAARHIAVPRVRSVPDYAQNQAAMALKGPFIRTDVASAPYVRHQEALQGMYEDQEAAEYDMDDEDEAFINKVNGITAPKAESSKAVSKAAVKAASKAASKAPISNGNGFMAAARGLYQHMASRLSSLSSPGTGSPVDASAATAAAAAVAAAAAAPSAGAGPSRSLSESGTMQLPKAKLTPDGFEKAIDKLEAAHFGALREWWQQSQEGPSTSTASLPKLPPLKTLLPKSRAADVLPDLEPKVAVAVYEHWAKRRAQEGGPLLPRLWFELPWKLHAFAYLADDEDSDDDDHLPFTASEPRSHRERRPGAARRKLSDEDAMENLLTLRGELEVVRTMADQVRKREKMKRQLMLLWQQEWRLRAAAGKVPSAADDERRRQQLLGLGGDVAAGAGVQRRQAAAAAAAVAAALAPPGDGAGPSRAAAVGGAEAGSGADASALAAGRKRGRPPKPPAAAPQPKRSKASKAVVNGALSTSEAPAGVRVHDGDADADVMGDSAEVDSRQARRAARAATAAAAAAAAEPLVADGQQLPPSKRQKLQAALDAKQAKALSGQAVRANAGQAGAPNAAAQPKGAAGQATKAVQQKAAQMQAAKQPASPSSPSSPAAHGKAALPPAVAVAAALARSPSGGTGKRWGNTGLRTPRALKQQPSKRGTKLRQGQQRQQRRPPKKEQKTAGQPDSAQLPEAGQPCAAAAPAAQRGASARARVANASQAQQHARPSKKQPTQPPSPPAQQQPQRTKQAAAQRGQANAVAAAPRQGEEARARGIGRRELAQLGLNVPPAVPAAAAASQAHGHHTPPLKHGAHNARRLASKAVVAKALKRTPQGVVKKRGAAVHRGRQGRKAAEARRSSGPRTPSLRELLQLVPDRPSSPPRERRQKE